MILPGFSRTPAVVLYHVESMFFYPPTFYRNRNFSWFLLINLFFFFFFAGEHPETKTMCMIVSDTGSVLVYDQTKLRWSAKLSFHPCIIARASFKVWFVVPRHRSK